MTDRLQLTFSDIRFGFRAAETEAAADRELLLEGYFDLHGAYTDVVNGTRSLVLGYKGSGKSALAQHMQLRAGQDDTLAVRTLQLSELSFHEFSTVVPDGVEWYSRYPKVWALVLWLQLIDMFRGDRGSPSRLDTAFQEPVANLETARLLPVAGVAEAVRDYVHHPFTVPGTDSAAPGAPSSGRMLALSRLVSRLRDTAEAFRSNRRFMLIVDGTDEVFTGEQQLYQVYAALLEATSRLNNQLTGMAVDAKVVVLCRTDLFNRLPGSNMNKLKGDCGVELNWYEDARNPSGSALAKLANLKAKVADPRIQDIFAEYLPERISRGGRPSRRTLNVLLDHTRHTPRDLLQLLTCIAQVDRNSPNSRNPGRVSGGTVNRGISRYSRDYFAGEIEDEVWGHLQIPERVAITPILIAIGRPRFSPHEFARIVEESFPELNPGRLLEVLYDCSAIGNARDMETRRDQITRITFKYRNPESNLNLSEDVFVHNGWRTKLNIVDESTPPGPRGGADSEKRVRRRSRTAPTGRTPPGDGAEG